MDTQFDLVRHEVVAGARTIVVKVGTNVLSKDDDTLDDHRLDSLAAQMHLVRESGRQVVLVSSGAIGAGIGLLGLEKRPDDLPHLQAAAAVGQAHLIRRYDDCLNKYGYRAAQLLLTANDFRHRGRYLNVRNTLRTLFEYNTIPIVNENDTVSVQEIQFGDNDRLAALVANLLESPLLVILSVIDGLYDGDPADPRSRVVPLVERFDDSLLGMAVASRSRRGTGGMQSKLEAARMVTAVGESVIIANGRNPRALAQILAGEPVGTLFLAQGESLPAWKRWIGYSVAPRGKLQVDAGARRAIAQRGKSLLPIGITSVHGDFHKGELVALADPSGVEFGRGLTNYNSHDARRIAGRKTEEIAAILGNMKYEEVIHVDNLVVTVTGD
ncbi:MAG: glutamate 5-kinase [Planctomycetaceae bacterium]|nr:MAG: glutamate 5-kinase [Planctomycetaceae bacterium]